ncbi:MAG: hypothetical protein DSZ06_04580 [Sulfurospirillum sp.]|nr:MAG: hypothetical protein DSZ06_04580 [Sulfurospirillum sp.]
MKHKKIILTFLAIMLFSISAYSVDLNQTKSSSEVELNATIKDQNISDNFQKRFVYFDKSLSDDENFELIKRVILDAARLGFNGIVVEQEYIFTRLSHDNPIINKVKSYMGQIEKLAHKNGLDLVAMHFRGNVANEVVHDSDEGNPFYQKGKFDFSEANKATTIYEVNGSVALPLVPIQTKTSPDSVFGNLYSFDHIKLDTEYKITVDITTKDFKDKEIKVSVLDGDYNDDNGKVIFGVNKYFENIPSSKVHGKYSVYFNSLDHSQRDGKIKVYVQDSKGVTIHSVSVQEVGYTPKVHVIREDTTPIVSDLNGTIYKDVDDYILHEDSIELISDKIKSNKRLKVIWYPQVNTSLPSEQKAFSDICADEDMYYKILLDQVKRINEGFNNNVDAYAVDDDEWRTAGWDEKCIELYAKELNSTKNENFTGGDYIGISTKRLVEKISLDQNRSDLEFYLMSDMFDPNFNGRDPYMGVKGNALGAYKYLPKDQVIMFNWFPNPKEPGLENKTEADFLASAKHFADNGIRQIIAGYHDDMRNLDSNIAFYKKSDKKTQESIVGFMYLIWFQPGKNATYDDMDDVVERICKELPGKWPSKVCKDLELSK